MPAFDKDFHLIYENYLKKSPTPFQKMRKLTEAPVYGNEDMSVGDLSDAPGNAYGIGKVASHQKKSRAEIAAKVVDVIRDRLFKHEEHVVDGQTYQLYYPGSPDKFRNEIHQIVQDVLGINKTEAKYTARIVTNLLNVVKKDDAATGNIVANEPEVENAIEQGIEGQSNTEEEASGEEGDVEHTYNPAGPRSGEMAKLETIGKKADNGMQIYVKEFIGFGFKEYVPIFDALPAELEVKKDEDLYTSKKFFLAVVHAIKKVFGDTKLEDDKEYIRDFITTLKEKNAYVPETDKEAPDDVPDEDIDTGDETEGALRDQGIDLRHRERYIPSEVDSGFTDDNNY
jgi:hypothetical protein